MISFHEHHTEGYSARTRANVFNTNITLAFASNFDSPGEKCTMNHCDNQRKPYIALNVNNPNNKIADQIASELADCMSKSLFKNGLRVNIAGNSLSTLNCDQEKCDSYLTFIFERVFKMFGKHYIQMIGSGGQTGFDEAGLKMAQYFEIPAECIAPKNWMFRLRSGRDICDEKLFKERFV